MKKVFAFLLVISMLLVCLCACGNTENSNQKETTAESVSDEASSQDSQTAESDEAVTEDAQSNETPSDEASSDEAADGTAIDIETTGGVVIVGKIGMDDDGWYILPEQPLNVTYEYFLDKPSVFSAQTKIKMFDPAIDGIEKSLYIGQTVTAEGTFSFYRDDFETLYFSPYTIALGKNTENSYSAPDLQAESENLYDPSEPLPKYMDAMISDNSYTYNAFMLSQETLELMGNDFAVFYVGFVDAFLNYQSEFACSDKNFAEMLSTVIYYEFPLYNACAEPFEFFKDYDAEKGVVSIRYKYNEADFKKINEQFFAAADELLADVKADDTDEQKAKAIYHALATRMTYDDSALENFERKESYYAYLHNSGVCVTFANVYNQLLTQVGIKTTVAHCDDDETIGHSWSIVTLDGKQYFCDPTYELSYENGEGYKYFGMNYADRTANGLGADGIRYGRYYMTTLDAGMIAEKSLNK